MGALHSLKLSFSVRGLNVCDISACGGQRKTKTIIGNPINILRARAYYTNALSFMRVHIFWGALILRGCMLYYRPLKFEQKLLAPGGELLEGSVPGCPRNLCPGTPDLCTPRDEKEPYCFCL